MSIILYLGSGPAKDFSCPPPLIVCICIIYVDNDVWKKIPITHIYNTLFKKKYVYYNYY